MSKKFNITTSFLYKWRYFIGYGTIFILLAGLLFVAGFLIPGELSASEERALITSQQLEVTELWRSVPINAPFHILQHFSLELFGATILGIKLPSLILGIITAISMIFLLRRWFTPGVAVLAAAIAITTGQFLFVAQQGSAGIMYLFWPTVLLLLATLVANRLRYARLWQFLCLTVAALSLYTPLGIYVILALASAILLHPHLRHIVYRLPNGYLAVCTVFSMALLTPLALTVISDPSYGLRLLGVPSQWPDLLANLQQLGNKYFGFMSLGSTSALLPVFSLSSMLLILYGLYRSIHTSQTVQSYVVLAWMVLLIPVLVINPSFTSIIFVPLFLLLASGLEGMLRRWYRLFPRNPYARVAGLLPLIVLVSSMMMFGLERYSYGYQYAPDIVNNFSKDILLIPETDKLVVSPDQFELYTAVASYHDNLEVLPQAPASGGYAVTADAYDPKTIPSSVVTTGRSDDAARFYLYE